MFIVLVIFILYFFYDFQSYVYGIFLLELRMVISMLGELVNYCMNEYD